jgi:hypothetical protein
LENGVPNKREAKAETKNESTEKSGQATDWEELNETTGLNTGEQLKFYKTTNSMNNMLPSVRDAHVEADKIKTQQSEKSEKRKLETDPEEMLQKR